MKKIALIVSRIHKKTQGKFQYVVFVHPVTQKHVKYKNYNNPTKFQSLLNRIESKHVKYDPKSMSSMLILANLQSFNFSEKFTKVILGDRNLKSLFKGSSMVLK